MRSAGDTRPPGWPEVADAAASFEAPPVTHFPLPGWPSRETVEYLSKLILLGLLLLAVPYVLGNLLVRPAETLVVGGEGLMTSPPIPSI